MMYGDLHLVILYKNGNYFKFTVIARFTRSYSDADLSLSYTILNASSC